jgi:NAD(P)-dependent dehydrogenase (short-subunit alcohol dehydrogenase family)
MGEWSGRVAFVTGGSQRIGRAAAELLAAEGASVASPRASFVTGVDVRVDGGLLAMLPVRLPE